VLNASTHVAQFWDGRAADVEEQAKGPILNPIEMGMPDEATVVGALRDIDGYAPLFAAAFPDAEAPITYDNLANAIGAFERTLITPSRFDAYLAGDGAALTDDERAGLDLFVSTGCTACHSGTGLGGSLYMKLGLVTPYETADVGRMEVTGLESDKHVFKVPGLRNIAETGPYFHDGSIGTLEEAVILMANHQLGKNLSTEEADSIVTFLKALTGELPEGAATVPEMPT
jgi:cytochrome c peroxidase